MSGFELEGVSLSALAGLDITEVAAKSRGDTPPRMLAKFACVDAELVEVTDSGTGAVKGYSAKWTFEIRDILKMIDTTAKIEDWVGKKYVESNFIQNEDGVAYALGFVENCGGLKRGKFGEAILSVVGREIQAIIKITSKKDDPDVKYANLSAIKKVA